MSEQAFKAQHRSYPKISKIRLEGKEKQVFSKYRRWHTKRPPGRKMYYDTCKNKLSHKQRNQIIFCLFFKCVFLFLFLATQIYFAGSEEQTGIKEDYQGEKR